jgi:pilus assembly protein Flp/PilA
MKFSTDELGQGLFEYAVIIVLVALIVIVLLAIFGEAVVEMYKEVLAQI